MCDENQIRIDTIYKLMFMDGIKYRYTRYVADQISYLDSIIKYYLCEKWGVRGFFLAAHSNWKLIAKFIFIDQMDILSVHSCDEYKQFSRNLRQLRKNVVYVNSKYAKINTLRTHIEQWKYSAKNWLSLKYCWKPLHPFTYAKYVMMKHQRTKMKIYNVWELSPAATFEWAKKFMYYLIPIFHVVSVIFCWMTVAFYQMEMGGECYNNGIFVGYGSAGIVIYTGSLMLRCCQCSERITEVLLCITTSLGLAPHCMILLLMLVVGCFDIFISKELFVIDAFSTSIFIWFGGIL
eukprot:217080_1